MMCKRDYPHNTLGVILGGPTTISAWNDDIRLWTVLTSDGKTKVWAESELRRVPPLWKSTQKVAISALHRAMEEYERRIHTRVYSNVIEQDCPSCDNDEMIFYEGDYICAWCREMIERD